jgi:uncharacterized membrane protein YhiD involved in acid resistance
MESGNLKLLESILIALALGVLVGAEREMAKSHLEDHKETIFAGIRTFALISLLGALSLHFANYFERVFFLQLHSLVS